MNCQMNLFKTIVLSLMLCLLSTTTWAAEPNPAQPNPAQPNPTQSSPAKRIETDSNASITTPQGKKLSREQLFEQISKQQIVYLGETHDSARDHQIQLEIIDELHRRNPKITIAFEQFQRPYQSVLDDYLQGKITESQLVENSEYKKRWGFPWTLYAPIVQFAKQQQFSLIALNTPSEITRKVSRQGLESLNLSDRRFIPPIGSIQVGPDAYRDRIQKIYQEMHQGKGNSQGFNRFFEAQVLWDETMADRLAQAVKQNPNDLIIVLVGQGHLLYHDGIPNRVKRRLSNLKTFQQTTILLNPDPTWNPIEPTTKQPIADILWSTPTQNP
jgi:uncharacterized iron-regulated protein